MTRAVELRSTKGFAQTIVAGPHTFTADEPREAGGTDTGPGPYELLGAALGACTAMTLRMYADRKGWPLAGTLVTVTHDRVHAEDCRDCETKTGRIDRLVRTIVIDGPLEAEQIARLREIADKCPVHRTLTSEILIETSVQTGTP
jgi:uncharacterized OsmC-like protein